MSWQRWFAEHDPEGGAFCSPDAVVLASQPTLYALSAVAWVALWAKTNPRAPQSQQRPYQRLARDLIAKQKHRQAEQECARWDEKHDLRYINHAEILHAKRL
jgi:hypothetical protein